MLLLFIRFLPPSLPSLAEDLFLCGDDSGCVSKATVCPTLPCLGYESCVLFPNADRAVLSAYSRLPDCVMLSAMMLLRACGMSVILADRFVVEAVAVSLGFV